MSSSLAGTELQGTQSGTGAAQVPAQREGKGLAEAAGCGPNEKPVLPVAGMKPDMSGPGRNPYDRTQSLPDEH